MAISLIVARLRRFSCVRPGTTGRSERAAPLRSAIADASQEEKGPNRVAQTVGAWVRFDSADVNASQPAVHPRSSFCPTPRKPLFVNRALHSYRAFREGSTGWRPCAVQQCSPPAPHAGAPSALAPALLAAATLQAACSSPVLGRYNEAAPAGLFRAFSFY